MPYKDYDAHRKEIYARNEAYRKAHRDQTLLARRKRYAKRIEKERERRRQYYQANREKMASLHREWRAKNPEKTHAISNAWKKAHPERVREYTREKMRTDPSFRIKNKLHVRVCELIRKSGTIKHQNTITLVGCTLKELMNHLESQFKQGMSWENHGLHGWHIDHIRPCASFDLTDPAQQRACFHWTNLQPLWAADNREKSDKIVA